MRAPRTADAAEWIRGAMRFRPHGVTTDELLVGTHAETIAAIEALYNAILLIGGADTRRDAQRPPIDVSAADGRILLTSSVTETTIAVDRSAVTIGGTRFTSDETRQLFATLAEVMTDAGASFAPHGARMTQYRTPEYAKFTRIEFSYGTPVVVLEGRSKDGDGDDRYSLDVMPAADSLLWRATPPPAPAAAQRDARRERG